MKNVKRTIRSALSLLLSLSMTVPFFCTMPLSASAEDMPVCSDLPGTVVTFEGEAILSDAFLFADEADDSEPVVSVEEIPFPIAFQQGKRSETQREKYMPEERSWYGYSFIGADGGSGSDSIEDAGCSLLSVVNSIYYKTGVFINPCDAAQFALDKKYRRLGVTGVTLPFFADFVQTYGEDKGVSFAGSTTSAATALAHVRNGGTSCSNVYGHWIAVVDYDSESDRYLILDSASYAASRTNNITWTNRENGVAWLSAATLSGGFIYGTYGFNGAYSQMFSYSEPAAWEEVNVPYTYTVHVTDNGLNLRERPTTISPIITSMPDGTEVKLLQTNGVWSLVSVNDMVGYCSMKYLEPNETVPPEPAEPVFGDLDGNMTIDIADAGIILSIYAANAASMDNPDFTPEQIAAADLNHDGVVDTLDASAILLYYAQSASSAAPSWEEIFQSLAVVG